MPRKIDGRVAGCLRCGSHDLRPARLDDAIVPGTMDLSVMACNRCGHVGPELLFADEAARADYEASLERPDP